MKIIKYNCITILVFVILIIACKKTVTGSDMQNNEANGIEGYENGILTDIDGNTYTTVQIGNQIWVAENWKCIYKTDGTIISGVHVYDNDDLYLNEYGRLYTWQAAADASPTGWHLPSADEWESLIEYVGSSPVEKLRIGGSSGLNLKMGGRRTDSENDYGYLGLIGIYWTSTQSDLTHATVKMIVDSETNIITDNTLKNGEVSVRYIKNDN